MKRLRCFWNRIYSRIVRRTRWDGHCWGPGGCIDCGKGYS